VRFPTKTLKNVEFAPDIPALMGTARDVSSAYPICIGLQVHIEVNVLPEPVANFEMQPAILLPFE
jgi:hypothetical protein